MPFVVEKAPQSKFGFLLLIFHVFSMLDSQTAPQDFLPLVGDLLFSDICHLPGTGVQRPKIAPQRTGVIQHTEAV